jgi:hypothetical protein
MEQIELVLAKPGVLLKNHMLVEQSIMLQMHCVVLLEEIIMCSPQTDYRSLTRRSCS